MVRGKTIKGLLSLCLVGLALLPAVQADDLPTAVSLDYCADQYALALAEPGQIMALSPGAADIYSFYRDKARGLPVFKATSEEVLYMQPDKALSTWGAYGRIDQLARGGVEVVNAAYGADSETVFANLMLFGEALGQSGRAKALVAQLQATLASYRSQPPLGLRAVYITPSGFSAGEGTFVDSILRDAGLSNIAGDYGLKGWGPVPLELLVMNPPDIFVATFFDMETSSTANWSLARHARMKAMLETIPVIEVPSRYFACNGLFFVETIDLIRTQAASFVKPVQTAGGKPIWRKDLR